MRRSVSLLFFAGPLALALALALAVTGCSQPESEAQMRERVRRQERQRQQRLVREREQQETQRRLLRKQRSALDAARRARPVSGEDSMSAGAMGREKKSEGVDARAAVPRGPPRRPRVASMSAPLRYRPARPAPRRRLKRPRRQRSPSLEGLFE